jgi:medium-chain acyl-[acyl-carrier-protein] hydrolase
MPARLPSFPARVPSNPWWYCPRPDDTAPLRLWCFPFVGGGAAVWHPWAGGLTGVAEVRAVRLPGRETRLHEPLFRRSEDLVAALAAQIAPHTGRPYAFCGHSLGAIIGFEVTRRLRALGTPLPRMLVVSGSRAPHRPRPESPLHPLDDPEFVAQLDARYGGIPPELLAQPDVLALLLPATRADLEVYETYTYRAAPPLDVPVLALGGEADQAVSRDDVLGWREHTRARFEADFFPGGHFFQQQDVATVAGRVRRFLMGAGDGGG